MAERETRDEFASDANEDFDHTKDVMPLEPGEAKARHVPREVRGAQDSNVHPVVGEIAIGATIWFVVVVWLSFGTHGDFLSLAIVTLFFVMFFGLFLLTASYSWHDPRWSLPELSFHDFLKSNVRVDTGTLSGREVLIQVALIPVALALAATAIGFLWVVLR